VIDAPLQQPVTELFATWALRQPDAIAVTQGVRQWSYRALADAANRIAQALHRRGIGPGDVVAIAGSRSFGLVSSVLGVWLCRGVFLNLDGTLPEIRRRTMLREARAKVICRVGAAPLPDSWSETPASAMVLDIDPDLGLSTSEDTVQPSDGVAFPPIQGDDAAYIFFTSGSTGVPKGVLGCHKGLSHFLAWQRQTFAIGPADRVAQLTGLSFDVFLRDVFLPLTSGGTLCIPEEADEARPLAWLARERVTVVHTVPTLLRSWLAQRADRPVLGDLRWLFLSGEPLSGALVQAWRDRFPGSAEVVNLYGPTETTMIKCFHRVAGEIQPGFQPVGLPMPQTQALVLNAAGCLCGIGELGEVVLRTPYRSLGYINAPQEMRKRFVPNPFRDGDGSDLLYYTGDRGRYRPDGTLDLAGRLDDQVKIRGVRVEPGEVQAMLEEHPGVQTCFVMGRKDARGDDCLVAYLVRVPGHPVTIGELRSFAGARLPGALVPSAWQLLDDLPRLPSGKVDRERLPAPDAAAYGSRTYEAPVGEVETALALIWTDALKRERVGRHDNFFQLGGHSLLAIQMLSWLRDVLGVEVSVGALFLRPTIAGLAEHVSTALEGNDQDRVLPIRRRQRSFAQQR
jgi:amino acid adenylation domain-containing protein